MNISPIMLIQQENLKLLTSHFSYPIFKEPALIYWHPFFTDKKDNTAAGSIFHYHDIAETQNYCSLIL